jgi:hypothetical protein
LCSRGLGKRIEVDIFEPYPGSLESRPQRLLAADTDNERFQLDYTAQRRVPKDATVELQAAEVFGGAHGSDLQPARGQRKPTHDVFERCPVASDLPCERMIRAKRPPGQGHAPGRSGMVIL